MSADYWGVCPECGRHDGFLNVRESHWMVCHAHHVKWWVGANLFSGWRDEDVTDWFRNELQLFDYRDVAPAIA